MRQKVLKKHHNTMSLIAAVLFTTIFSLPAFGQYHKIDSLQALLHREDDTVKVNVLNKLSETFFEVEGEKDSSVVYAKQALKIAGLIGFKIGQYRAFRNLAKAYNQSGRLRDLLHVNQLCVRKAIEIGDKRLIGFAKNKLAASYRYLNYHTIAFKESAEAHDIFVEIGDVKNQVITLVTLGNICTNTKDFASARRYYQRATDLSQQDPYTVNQVNMNLALLLQEEGKYRESFPYIDQSLAYFEKEDNKFFVAFILFLKGRACFHTGEPNRAINSYLSSLTCYNTLESITGRSRCYIELGNVALSQSKNEQALEYFLTAEEIMKEMHKSTEMEKIYTGLVKSYEALGEYKKSFESQKMVSVFKDSLNATFQREKLNELQMQYDKDQADHEIAALKAEKQNHYTMITLLALVIISSAVFVIMVVRRQEFKIKISEDDNQNLKQILSAKDEVEEQLKLELEGKAKELTAFTLNMIQKKEMLESVKSGIEEMKSKIEGEARTKLNRVLTTINLSQRLDKDWDNFRLYFEHVHQGFFDNLSSTYPELNSNDLKLCALIRLNLDTKQIASVLDIAPESAKVAKHRIRKKLGLASYENLSVFFSQLSHSNNNF